MKQCYSPIETIRRLIPSKISENESPFGHYQGDRYKEWQDLNTSIQVDTSVAEAMKCIQEGTYDMQKLFNTTILIDTYF